MVQCSAQGCLSVGSEAYALVCGGLSLGGLSMLGVMFRQ